MKEVLIVFISWIVYFSLHSLLASFWVKGTIKKSIPSLFPYYRIIYNIISILGLLLILFYLAVTPSAYLVPKSEILQFLGLALSTWGLVFLRLAFKQYSIREFLGLQKSGVQSGQKLVIEGVLKKVRHPIYTGTLLIVIGFFLFNPKLLNLVTLICVVIYVLIGIKLEERKLEKEFGDQYREYKKKVPGLVPRW